MPPLSPTPVQCHYRSTRKYTKTPERGKGNMATLIGGSSTIRTSVSAGIYDSKTGAAYNHEESRDKDGNTDVSSTVTSTPPHVGISKVAITTPKTNISL